MEGYIKSRDPEERTLTTKEAFLVMSDFVGQFYERAGDDMVTLIADIAMGADDMPWDPAAWNDWLASVDRIKSGAPPRTF